MKNYLLIFTLLFPLTCVAQSGYITTIAGTGMSGFAGDGGPATGAAFNGPKGMIRDGSGNLYISDYFNHRIRKISSSGVVTTIAGIGSAGYSGDGGAATAANLNYPVGLAIDGVGNVYFADAANQHNLTSPDARFLITWATFILPRPLAPG